MASVYGSLYQWARKTTSSFSELLAQPERLDHVPAQGGELIYRLRRWPELPAGSKTADIYRMLSVMSSRPVNRQWVLRHCGLDPAHADRLLGRLIDAGALEVIDPSKFRPSDF